MSVKRKIQIITDISMTVLLPFLMAYVLVGEEAHEWIGSAMFLLFILHHVWNRSWYKNIGKGKYNGIRILGTAINVALMVIMFALMISGLMMSKYVYGFLPVRGGISTARAIHLLASNWGYVLMSLHLGLHWNIFLKMIKKMGAEKEQNRIAIAVMRGTAALISVYGAYAFRKRDMGSYLFLTNRFAFFDYHEPLIYFLMDYVAVMGVFICLGYCFTKICKRHRKISSLVHFTTDI